ncbi:MAG: hypothetical protein ACTSPJ_04295, partial [Candidatus Heimdallarchaeaceae archaeon]
MKLLKWGYKRKKKYLGMVMVIFTLILSQIITNSQLTENLNIDFLDLQQNNVKQSSDYQTVFQRVKEENTYTEIEINSFSNEIIDNNFSGEKVSQALTSFGSWPIYVGGELKGGPGAGDIDGDGNYEIVVGTLNGLIRAYEIDGTECSNWSGGKNIGVAITSTPMLADIDSNTATEEIIVGTANGSVYAFFGNGTVVPGWPVNCEGAVEESLAVGDINGDGKN